MIPLVAGGLSLVACAPSMGRTAAPVRTEFAAQTGTALPLTRLSDAEVSRLLAAPLTLAAATELALGNHRAIAKQWAVVAGAQGLASEAWKPAALSLHGTYRPDAEETFELDVLQDISSFIGLGARRGIGKAALREAQLGVLAGSYGVMGEVAKAYYQAAAARASLALAQQTLVTTEVAATFAQRLAQAGNATDLSLLQAQDAYESMRHMTWQAEAAAATSEAMLARAMGVSDVGKVRLAEVLPEVPAAAPDLTTLATDAADHNVAVRQAIAQADGAVSRGSAATLGRFLPTLGLGVAAAYGDAGWSLGPAAAISLPLFGQGAGAKRAADAMAQAAAHDAAQFATLAATEVIAVKARVMKAHQRARHLAEVVVPLRQQIVAATLLQYNAMAQSPFALLAARERELAARIMLIDATMQYWQAMADVAALRRGVVLDATASMGVSAGGAGGLSGWSAGAVADH